MRKQCLFRASPRGLLAWDVDRLIALTRDLPRQRVALADIRELDESVFGPDEPATWRRRRRRTGSCNRPPSGRTGREARRHGLLAHIGLMDEADAQYPIILAADGRVMEGRRALRAPYFIRPQPKLGRESDNNCC